VETKVTIGDRAEFEFGKNNAALLVKIICLRKIK
jgi:hypothetical protein